MSNWVAFKTSVATAPFYEIPREENARNAGPKGPLARGPRTLGFVPLSRYDGLIMRALCLGLLLTAASASAQIAAPGELFSIARAGLSRAEVGDIVESGRGRVAAVGDRLIDVSSSTAVGNDVPLTETEGASLVAARVQARLVRLRAAAREGRLTEQDRAEARALAVLREATLAWNDRYFLGTLNPDEETGDSASGASAPRLEMPDPGPAGAADPLSLQLRSRLALDDHGDPKQAEALDMAVRLMLQSPTARELSAEFVKQNRTVKVSFEPLDGGAVDMVGQHKYVSGVGGLTTHGDGEWVQINAGYLQVEPRDQFHDVPGTLAHELLGHVYNEIRAENAGVSGAMNLWRGDEDTAGVTGWLVSAEVNGKVPADPYCWSYLDDPAKYHRTLDLVTAYYAQSLSPDEAAHRDEVYSERLGRVQACIAAIQAQLDDRTDWAAILDHFENQHGVEPWRLRALRDDLLQPSTAGVHVELERLLDIRRALTQDLAGSKDPVRRSENADLAKRMSDPFFADSEKRLAALSGRLRAFAAARKPAPAIEVPEPGVTVTTSLSWDDVRRMYENDKRDHPEHWPTPAPKT